MRLGEPHVKRYDACLDAEPDEAEHRDDDSGGTFRWMREEVGEREAVLAQQDERADHARDAEVRRDQVHPTRTLDLGLNMIEHDEQIARERHHLPRHEKSDRVAREQHEQHCGDQQVVEAGRRG